MGLTVLLSWLERVTRLLLQVWRMLIPTKGEEPMRCVADERDLAKLEEAWLFKCATEMIVPYRMEEAESEPPWLLAGAL